MSPRPPSKRDRTFPDVTPGSFDLIERRATRLPDAVTRPALERLSTPTDHYRSRPKTGRAIGYAGDEGQHTQRTTIFGRYPARTYSTASSVAYALKAGIREWSQSRC
ncbi:hypothetical protein [Actinomadura sp. BRA 177]|uniref:hypothetical protein n=1 Tax=Actinomadura sp. BRA 177 TaxID=2745202 RepID=UPI001595DBE3|nr:hypothetical protein [Actinomadura sp. BRA 177]NVI91845.1 hypothetical protein [Actinomadura sp. BRA 177]